jgi:membrane protease YdiL (CAAX protease family)
MSRLLPDAAIFLGGAILVLLVVRIGVPWLASFGMDRFAAWMILSALFVFVPVIAAGILLLRRDPHPLRFTRPTRRAWAWAALGALVIAVGSLVMKTAADKLGLSIDPFDRAPRPWATWMFAAWLVYWPLNILGEEFVWRGVVLPRMEKTLGPVAWLPNAALWALFHVGFGPGNVMTLVPTLLLVPLIAQKTGSTWTAVALHAFVSLPGMALIATGRL